MAALPGTLDEWKQDKDGRWSRKGHPEDGVIALTPPLTFAEYYAQRAEPAPPPPDPIHVKIAYIETRLAKLEAATATRT